MTRALIGQTLRNKNVIRSIYIKNNTLKNIVRTLSVTNHLEEKISVLRERNGRLIDISGEPSNPKEVPGPRSNVQIPSRHEQLRNLQSHTKSNPYDVLVIGGGATGVGCALDAKTRGDASLKVGCIERGDFASETSSRSTKLIWAGIRYLATASASLLSKQLLTNPIDTVQDFIAEFKMVVNCHRERRYMLEKQAHLCNWVPIAIPFTSWVVTPAPFGHPLFSLFPILAPFVFKFYDSLSGFSCPPSYILGKKKSKLAFPQLCDREIKYCSVFYEAQHNDSRTNLAIAMTAAEYGCHIANYVEMTSVIYNNGRAEGIWVRDRMTGHEFSIYSNKIIFSGGPFTDSLRQMENDGLDDNKPMKKVVASASGTHVVLPGYYSPNNMGLLDFNTSDGRFLFYLPWLSHTLVGTTDVKCAAQTIPKAPEDEIQWILNESSKYLSDDVRVRRSDVLSAWRGWRPLAAAPDSDVISRDHVIYENPDSGIIYIAGGKWVTWREMSQDTVDKVTDLKCNTMDITLYGGTKRYSSNLSIQLIQKYGMTQDTAEHLAKTYGGQAWDVCELAKPTHQTWPRFGIALAPNYPYIDAEVRYACREYACTIEDILSRRTRLAFLNKEAALVALPKVADIMAEELGWSEQIKQEQIFAAQEYIATYGGRIPDKKGSTLRDATYTDVTDIFSAIDADGNGYLDQTEVGEVASVLGFPMNEMQLKEAFQEMDVKCNGRVTLEEFVTWWNHNDDSYFRDRLTKELSVGKKASTEDLKSLGQGTFFG